MKLSAIINRGSKKDFIDLFILLKEFSLNELLDFYQRKYGSKLDFVFLKALTYFYDAEADPSPQLFIDETWDTIKSAILKNVNLYIRSAEG